HRPVHRRPDRPGRPGELRRRPAHRRVGRGRGDGVGGGRCGAVPAGPTARRGGAGTQLTGFAGVDPGTGRCVMTTATQVEVPADRPRPGRRRDPLCDEAIFAATLALFVEEGYAGVSIEGVAARAGVAKAT